MHQFHCILRCHFRGLVDHVGSDVAVEDHDVVVRRCLRNERHGLKAIQAIQYRCGLGCDGHGHAARKKLSQGDPSGSLRIPGEGDDAGREAPCDERVAHVARRGRLSGCVGAFYGHKENLFCDCVGESVVVGKDIAHEPLARADFPGERRNSLGPHSLWQIEENVAPIMRVLVQVE